MNIDDGGHPLRPVPTLPNRTSGVPAALRHSYTSAGSEISFSAEPIPHDCRMRADLVVEVHRPRHRVRLGPPFEHRDGVAALGEQDGEGTADGPVPDDRHVGRRRAVVVVSVSVMPGGVAGGPTH